MCSKLGRRQKLHLAHEAGIRWGCPWPAGCEGTARLAQHVPPHVVAHVRADGGQQQSGDLQKVERFKPSKHRSYWIVIASGTMILKHPQVGECAPEAETRSRQIEDHSSRAWDLSSHKDLKWLPQVSPSSCFHQLKLCCKRQPLQLLNLFLIGLKQSSLQMDALPQRIAARVPHPSPQGHRQGATHPWPSATHSSRA